MAWLRSHIVLTSMVEPNPFTSIMTMLCNNKCWLCEGVFARGKIKKVFMVSHLLRLLKGKYEEMILSSSHVDISSSEISVSNGLLSPHLVACFEDYCRLGGDEEKISRRLQDVECETWMSGLICCRTSRCAEEYLLIVPEGKIIIPKTEPKMKNGQECPPDCDCDNPWQYVADVLNSTSTNVINSTNSSSPPNTTTSK